MKEKVVLAYSGGLDTTTLIPWLKETFDYEVICCCIDCGPVSYTHLDNLFPLKNCRADQSDPHTDHFSPGKWLFFHTK